MYEDRFGNPHRATDRYHSHPSNYDNEAPGFGHDQVDFDSYHTDDSHFEDGRTHPNASRGEYDHNSYNHGLLQSSSTPTYADSSHEAYDSVTSAQASCEAAMTNYRAKKIEEKLDKYGEQRITRACNKIDSSF